MATGLKWGAPPQYTWTFPICPHDVTVDLAAVGALEHELGASSGPLQGLLLGERRHSLTHVQAIVPLLSPAVESVSAAVSAAPRPVVGYYRIREGAAFILDPTEIALAKSDFTEPGSVVLLIERRDAGPAEGTFAFWRGEAFVSNLPHPFPIDSAILAVAPPPAPCSPAAPEYPEPHRSLLRRHAGAIGTVAAFALGVLLLPLMWIHSGPAPDRAVPLPAAPAAVPEPEPRPPALSLIAHSGHDVQIAWDRRAISTATAGLLKIVDGDVHHHVSLDLDQLRYGSIVYTPGPGPVSVELKVLLAGGEMVAIPATAAAAPSTTSAPAKLPVAVVAPPPASIRASRATVPARTRQLPLPPSPVAQRRQLAKRFEPASDNRRLASNAPALPDAPAVQASPASAPILNASLSAPPPPASARIRLGGPVERAPAPSLDQTASGSGRLIWTGTLQRRGVVEFEGRSVSVGSLSGALPGVPVHVTVSPAEFGDHGLVVYTTDARLSGHVEPPSAANGWNRITYRWDPERARQIAVLETPNPSNRFSHLALRSDARNVSMLVIDWKAQTGPSATR